MEILKNIPDAVFLKNLGRKSGEPTGGPVLHVWGTLRSTGPDDIRPAHLRRRVGR
jgi:hypothetical protein